MDGVLDFIILKDTFTAAISKEWPANTKFHSFIDGSWWSGNVLERRAVSVDYPNSHWLCYNVQWEDGNVESISPWDMSHIPLEGMNTYTVLVKSTGESHYSETQGTL
jgi:bromodomain and WD repeat domain-containing protein 1/3